MNAAKKTNAWRVENRYKDQGGIEGGARKSPNKVTGAFSTQCICFRKTSGSNMRGRPTCFLPWAPSNLVAPRDKDIDHFAQLVTYQK